MNRQTVKRLAAKGIMTYVAVFALVLMVAMPAMALIAARNSVDRRAIINGEVTYKDIGKGQVRTSELGPKSVRYGKIADGAVRGNHIRDGHVKSADIGDGSIANADLGSNAVDANKIKDGSVGSADIGDGSITNADISSGAAISDSKISYSTKTKYLNVVGAAFRPEESEGTNAKFKTNTMGSLWAADTSDSSSYFYAPVYLPQGAQVTSVRLNVWDDYSLTSFVELWRRASDGGRQELALASSTGTIGAWRNFDDNTITTAYKTIDNENYPYFLLVGLSGTANIDMKLGFVRITYTVAAP